MKVAIHRFAAFVGTGLLASIAHSQTYQFTNLGTLGDQVSETSAINNRGDVVRKPVLKG